MNLYDALNKNTNFNGDPRRFGIEIEYAGLPMEQSVEILSRTLNATVHGDHKTKYRLNHPDAGEFILELDVELAQKISEQAATDKDQNNDFSYPKILDSFLPDVLGKIAPSELVTPPLTTKHLPLVEDAIKALRQAGAKGTEQSLAYAFGLHINPEVTSTDPHDIRDILRSFILLHDLIISDFKMNFTRRLSGYAAPFSTEYARHILDPDYQPDLKTLIADYINHHPTRNMALDMLPLFKFLDADYVDEHCPDSLINTRPTFHYRLPDSRITDPDWNLNSGLHSWLLIEQLAEEKDLLHSLSMVYLEHDDGVLSNLSSKWDEHLRQSLQKHDLYLGEAHAS